MNFLDNFRKITKKKHEGYKRPKDKEMDKVTKMNNPGSYKEHCLRSKAFLEESGYDVGADGSIKRDRYSQNYSGKAKHT